MPSSPGTPLPPPEAGKSVNVRPAGGRVLIREPGSGRFVPLEEGAQIPLGSTIDARSGVVELTSAADRTRTTQTGLFSEGVFTVTQTSGDAPITVLGLAGGDFSACRMTRRARTAATASARKRKRKGRSMRHLWGNASGRFRTKGKGSDATVRGTVWLVDDRCDGTLTAVRRGSVTVRDFRRRRTVIVTAPRAYLAAYPAARGSTGRLRSSRVGDRASLRLGLERRER